jgi:polyphosphate kinase
MTRNLHHRIEVCVPVKDQELTDELTRYFDIQWQDNVKSSPVDRIEAGEFSADQPIDEVVTCSQQEIYNYLKTRQ